MKSKIKKKLISIKYLFSLALGYSLDIERALDFIYQQLDLLLFYKRRYKYLKFVLLSFVNNFTINSFSIVH
jgi:hypothetical protein